MSLEVGPPSQKETDVPELVSYPGFPAATTETSANVSYEQYYNVTDPSYMAAAAAHYAATDQAAVHYATAGASVGYDHTSTEAENKLPYPDPTQWRASAPLNTVDSSAVPVQPNLHPPPMPPLPPMTGPMPPMPMPYPMPQSTAMTSSSATPPVLPWTQFQSKTDETPSVTTISNSSSIPVPPTTQSSKAFSFSHLPTSIPLPAGFVPPPPGTADMAAASAQNVTVAKDGEAMEVEAEVEVANGERTHLGEFRRRGVGVFQDFGAQVKLHEHKKTCKVLKTLYLKKKHEQCFLE